MALTDQKKRLLKAKIAVALQNELGRVPTEDEINNIFLLSRAMYKAVLGLHFHRQKQKQQDSLLSSNYAHWLCPSLNPRPDLTPATGCLRKNRLYQNLYRYRER